MLPPESYRLARENADAHVQLIIEDVATGEGQTDIPVAIVSGPIARVFRGDASLLGRRASLQLHYYIPGQTNVRPGSVGVRLLSEIRAGRVVEAFVNTRGGSLQIPLGLCVLLDQPTDQARYVWSSPSQEEKGPWRGLSIAALSLALGAAAYLLYLR